MTRIRLISLAVMWLLAACGPTDLGPGATPREPVSIAPADRGTPDTSGAIYYVRPDGGSAEQCTGQTDAPYPGSGDGRPCAWDHLFRALPPDGPPRIAGGDTLIVGAGSYAMGYGAPGTRDVCSPDGAFGCHASPLPGGLDAAHPTRLLGAGWDRGCPNPPELWGTQRADLILSLAGASHVEIGCLELTDHSGCVESHPTLACERDTFPFGDWAATGLYAADSAGVYLHDVDIHGLAGSGVHAGRLIDWTVENVRIAGNGWAGWDGDLWEGESANSGTLHFRHWTVEWNGCGETWPGGEPAGCWAQTAGGYGDGVGTEATGGDWIIEDSAFLHNTSDGLDLLYHTLGGSIRLDRVRAEGNAGNQVKVAGQVTVANSLLVGNCAFFEGQPFTYNVDPCRALGNALELAYTGGERVSVVNSTVYGQGDGLVGAGPREGQDCDGTETLAARNTIFLGAQEFLSPDDQAFVFYQEGCGDLKMDSDYNLAFGAKNIECGAGGDYVRSGPHDRCQDPLIEGPLAGTAYGLAPAAGSPAIDTGDAEVCPAVDLAGRARPADGDGDGAAACDAGAYEYSAAPAASPTATVALPFVTARSGETRLARVNDFLYQLQDVDLAKVGATAYDLVVMDYAADGSQDTAYTAAEIDALKHSPGGEKIILAYMSIGEAETYRWYWNPAWDADGDGRPDPGAPAWLDVENPDWEGNYKVCFWDPGWQAIIAQYTGRLLDAGFDGAYLDIVDAYEYYAGSRPSAAQDMAAFVAAIRAQARARDPDFYILPQNAPELAAGVPGYLAVVDGIGQEDIYYGYDGDDVPTPADVTAALEGYLDLFAAAGKLVLTVDYATARSHVDDAYAQSRARGYVPFCTVRDLDRLIVNPGHEPD